MQRFFLALFLIALALEPELGGQEKESPARLPDGRTRDMVILKDDHKRTLEDIAEIRKLAGELEKELEQQTAYVTSMDSLRKAEKIESLAQRVQKRMKRVN